MEYTELSDEDREAIEKQVAERPDNREAIATLEREHYTLKHRLAQGASPNPAGDEARLGEIEGHVARLRGEGA